MYKRQVNNHAEVNALITRIAAEEKLPLFDIAPRYLSELAVSYTHLRAHETVLDLVCRLLLEKKKQNN